MASVAIRQRKQKVVVWECAFSAEPDALSIYEAAFQRPRTGSEQNARQIEHSVAVSYRGAVLFTGHRPAALTQFCSTGFKRRRFWR